MTGSFVGRGNQYIQLIKILFGFWLLGDLSFALAALCKMLYCSFMSDYICIVQVEILWYCPCPR